MHESPDQRAVRMRMEDDRRRTCEVARHVATHYFRLHESCHRAECRRARACAGPGEAPCIIEQKRSYEHMLPALHHAVTARLDALRAAGGLDGDDGDSHPTRLP